MVDRSGSDRIQGGVASLDFREKCVSAGTALACLASAGRYSFWPPWRLVSVPARQGKILTLCLPLRTERWIVIFCSDAEGECSRVMTLFSPCSNDLRNYAVELACPYRLESPASTGRQKNDGAEPVTAFEVDQPETGEVLCWALRAAVLSVAASATNSAQGASRHSDICKIGFTGSPATSRKIIAHASVSSSA
jgi:hypothetical protein